MPRFAANISTMFGEHDFADRVEAAAACGFEAVECQFPYDTPAEELRERLDATRTQLVLVNAPPGDFAAGDRGLASLPGRDADFEQSIETALAYAKATQCPRIHVMAGCPTDGDASRRFVARIRWAADRVVGAGKEILIEPMNHRDIPGYLLGSSRQAERVIEQVDRPNVKLQFDTYHLQIQEGDLLTNFERAQAVIGHVQFSSLPGRHEPEHGEVNHRWFFEQLDSLGYDGWVGAEYRPRDGTLAGLAWAAAYGIAPPG